MTRCQLIGQTVESPVKTPSKPDKLTVPDRVPFGLGKPKSPTYDEKYNVILWNDPVNTMDWVIERIVKIFPEIGLQQAAALMLIAHHNGSVIIGAWPKEQAELYRDQLENAHLTATIEKT